MDATKRITKNLGGNRLGSGNKNNISLRKYNRSTHDLSRAFRTTMNVGTLIPCFKELALNGDTWSIDIQALTRTIATQAPLYGAFKQQVDFFVCPIRLYNGLLHNNMVKMSQNANQVYLPKITLTHREENKEYLHHDLNNCQISSTALERYLGLAGIGGLKTTDITKQYVDIERKFQCVPELAYYDIYKNYYANKQEDKGVIIANGSLQTYQTITQLLVTDAIGGQSWNYTFRQDSTPPTVVTTNKDTYQQLDEPSTNLPEMLATRQYMLWIPRTFNIASLQVVLKVTNTGSGQTVITFQTKNIGDVFPNLQIVNDGDNLFLSNPDSQYCSTGTTTFEFYAVTYNRVWEYTDGIGLIPFDLEKIDDMRIAILRDTGIGNEFSINSQNYYPYKALYEVDSEGKSKNLNMQQGIAIKTYQSDLLQNWLQTEWIDGPNGVNALTAVDTSSGSFTIDSLNFANKLYNLKNRIAVGDGTYEDWQEAIYSTETIRRAEQPIYVGGYSQEVMFEEVVSTAAAEDQPLGTIAGHGIVPNDSKRGGKIEIRIEEPSYIIGIVSLTPRIDYSQGNDWDRCELSTIDDIHKPELDGIGFEDLLQERGAYWGTYWDEEDQKWIKLGMGKTPAWMNYMTAINKCYGGFAEENKNMIMTLNRRYEFDDKTEGISDLTTYIDPSKYNYVFADTTIESQNFWVQVAMKVECRRVMSAAILPYL